MGRGYTRRSLNPEGSRHTSSSTFGGERVAVHPADNGGELRTSACKYYNEWVVDYVEGRRPRFPHALCSHSGCGPGGRRYPGGRVKFKVGDKVVSSGNRFNNPPAVTGPGVVVQLDPNNEPYYFVQSTPGLSRWYYSDELRPATAGYAINYESAASVTVNQGTTVADTIEGLLRIKDEL